MKFIRLIFLFVLAISANLSYADISYTEAAGVSGPNEKYSSYGAIGSNTDHYGTQQYNAPNGELAVAPLYKLIGDVFTGPALDSNYWISSLGTGGSAVITNGELVISTGTTANNAVEVTSARTARFSGLAPNKLRIVIQLPDAGVANNIRHWGIGTLSGASILNGAMFLMNGTNFELDTYRNGVASSIANGTFNGQYGPTFNPGTTSHFYEIIYQPRQVIWLADNKIIHTLSAGAATWTADLDLPIHIGLANIGGSTTNVSFSARIATVARYGIAEMQPKSSFIVGLNAGTTLKYTTGNLHSLVLSAITNNSNLTLYDNTAASGTVIWSSGSLPANGTPFAIDLKKIPFSTGLTVTITGAAMNALVIYE